MHQHLLRLNGWACQLYLLVSCKQSQGECSYESNAELICSHNAGNKRHLSDTRKRRCVWSACGRRLESLDVDEASNYRVITRRVGSEGPAPQVPSCWLLEQRSMKMRQDAAFSLKNKVAHSSWRLSQPETQTWPSSLFFFILFFLTPTPDRGLKGCQLFTWLGTFIERQINKCYLINKCHLGNANVLAGGLKLTTLLRCSWGRTWSEPH